MSRSWSPMQENVFDFVVNGEGNAVITAVAGSGKSTTIIEAMNRLPSTCSAIFLAFNKSIADELKAKGVNARTFHSLTYAPVMRHTGCNNVDGDKLRKVLRANVNGDEEFLYSSFVTRLVGLGRQSGIGCLVADTESAWLDIVTYHDLELENENATLGRALELASSLLEWSNKSSLVDFDDMLYIPVRDGLSLPKFDFIFVDEAQDTNAIQRALLRKLMREGSRLVAVGDPSQAIYGFRGADSDSLGTLAEQFQCRQLPLTVSYRCPVSVVQYAQQWVDHIQPSPWAAQGEVVSLDTKWDGQTFQSGDLVVCRSTKPIIELAYRLMKEKVRARILGRDIGQGLKLVVQKMKANGIESLITKLEAWTDREVEKAIAKQQESKAEAVQDKTDAILCLIDGLSETNRTIPELLRVIDMLFAGNETDVVTLCTIHKSKGLEANRVFWLNRNACPAKWARQEWQRQQEVNLCYVAATRAQQSLILIEDGKSKKK